MKKQRGFTMSELLITMGIIGLVSALVLPSINRKVEESARKPALIRTIGWLESGLTNIITHNHRYSGENYTGEFMTLAPLLVKDITGGNESCEEPSGGWGDGGKPASCKQITDGTTIFDNLAHIMEIEPVADSSTYLSKIKDLPTEITDTVKATLKVYKPKKINTYIIVEPMKDGEISTYITKYPAKSDDVTLTRVLIDTNGDKVPNTYGKDIYLYGISNDGQLYEAGSDSYNKNTWTDEEIPTD